MDLAAPLGPDGVAFEIEGPEGLVAGAHGLPVMLDNRAPAVSADVDLAVGALDLWV